MHEKYIIKLPESSSSPLSIRAKVLVFEDPLSIELLQRVRKIAPSNANAVIIGDTGTGKELIAREIHQLSDRKSGPFVAVNCGAFSESLIESELFGHDKGAFTGAITSKQGWFEEANGGTLFLDEIGDMPLPLQVKLLRVIQESQVVRLGSRKTINIDVRIIAATNINLENAVAAGRFREDLFYRLNVATLELFPLKDRPKDIPPLIEHFLKFYQKRLNIKQVILSKEAFNTLVYEYPWPGNIRELENVIHHALLVCKGNHIQKEDLNLSKRPKANIQGENSNILTSTDEILRHALIRLFNDEVENLYEYLDKLILEQTYEYAHHNQSETSIILGISRNIVRAKLIEYRLLEPKKQRK